MTKKNSPFFSIFFYLVIACLLFSGCGGGGSDSAPATTTPPPTSHTPEISNLQYSPQTATQNQGNGTVTVTGTINYTDQGGDIASVTINKYTSSAQFLSTSKIPVQDKSGLVSSSINITSTADTTVAAGYIFEVLVTDLSGNSSNKLAGNFTVTPQTPAPAPAPASDALIGNFKFVFKIISTFTDRITLNTKTNDKTPEGENFYTGYNATFPAVTALGAWSPSLSKYLVVATRTYSAYVDAYYFTINTDNTLSGCYRLSSNSGSTWSDCYAFIPPSHKSPLGVWDMSMESKNDPIGINEVFEKKMAEDLEVQAQRTESASPVDADVISKINEMTAVIKKQK
jgi:hypothetical protein